MAISTLGKMLWKQPKILLDGRKVSKFKDLRDVKDGSVLVMKIPKHVTYEEVFPKAKQAMKPKAMKS